MEGLPEALTRMAMLAVAGSVVLGALVSAFIAVTHRRTTWLSGFLSGAIGIVGLAGLLANRDVLDLGGNLPWRFTCVGAALAGATLASRTAVDHASRDRASRVTPIVLGTVAFAVTGAVMFLGLVTVSLWLS